MNIRKLSHYLHGYDESLSSFLSKGLNFGFRLGFEGARVPFSSPNLKSAIQNPSVMNTKILKEVNCGRISGPYISPPFPTLRISPIGLQPKKTPGDFRMIHHLSYPPGSSVNSGIPDDKCSVSYTTVDAAIRAIKRCGRGAFMAKTDIQSAFRILPVHPDDYDLLGFCWNGQYYYDKCLPMGCSSSCRIFEAFSSALEWAARTKLRISEIEHILDDFFIVGPDMPSCKLSLDTFIAMCNEVGVPLAPDKTLGPATVLSFLGIELDSIALEARLPSDKLDKARSEIRHLLSAKKATLKELQSLTGLLNFMTTVIIPGRAFLRRVIDLTCGLTKPHHHRNLNKAAKADLHTWLTFLDHYNGKSLFLDDRWLDSPALNLYTDSSKSIGFGVVFGRHWTFGNWEPPFKALNITVLEFYPIVLALHLWGVQLSNKCVVLHTDNQALVSIINRRTSRDKACMHLLRKLVLFCMRNNILFQAQHIPGLLNLQADALSRLQITRFRAVSTGFHMDPEPTRIEACLHHANWLTPPK